MELQITEISAPEIPQKRKISEAQKKAQAKWRATHADKYREKCRQHSSAYYERHHEEILERQRARHNRVKNMKIGLSITSASDMSE